MPIVLLRLRGIPAFPERYTLLTMKQQDPPVRERHPPRLSLSKKVVYSVIPTLAMFGVLEIGLAILGVQPLIDTRDPYVGFANTVSLMEETTSVDGQPLLVTRPSKLVWFNEQRFLKSKPPKTYRVFCLGGSTTYGRPYSDLTSYCGWLREYLPLVDDGRQWEVINAGGVSYASYRVAMVMQELAKYEPDLFVVYSAHNEFLEKRTYASLSAQPSAWLGLQGWLSKARFFALSTRAIEIWQRSSAAAPPAAGHGSDNSLDLLPAEVDERLNHTIGPADYERDPDWEQNVLLHYEINLRRMIKIAQGAGAKIVFITPASNLKDCSPFKGLPGELSPAAQEEVRQLVGQIGTLIASGQSRQSLELLQSAALLDPENADVQFWLGRAAFEAGLEQEAETAFKRALNVDICALRAIDEIDQAIRRVAVESQVPLVDFGQLLAEKCRQELGHGCLGQEYFLDHVHPTVETHEQLARWIIADLQRTGIVSGVGIDDPALTARLRQTHDSHLEKIDRQEHGIALRNLAKVLHWAGKFSEAAPRAKDALKWLGDDAESRFVLADCLKNMSKPDEAIGQYELLFAKFPGYFRAFLPYGELLTDQGEDEQALGYLLLAVLQEPDNAYAHLTLGRNHLLREEFDFAIESLQTADRLQPQNPVTLSLLKQAREAAMQ